MRQTITSIWALLLAAGILFVGGGLQGSLVAVRANAEGFPLTQIGLMMSVYSVGFVMGCRWTPLLVKNVGHIRAFTALASIASAVALAYTLVVDPYAWQIMRGVSGFCFAGVAMIIESWINERAANAVRGRVLSVYRVVDLGGLTVGQLLLSIADPETFVLFALVSILVSFSLVPVALTTAVTPRPIESAQLNLRRVFTISPFSAFGTLLVGLASSAFWAVGPVYVQKLGYETWMISAFMGTVIMAGAIAQWPLGALSDRVDRRKLTLVVAMLAAVAGLLLVLLSSSGPLWLLISAGAWGFFAMSLFGLFVALANDYAEPTDYVALNASLLLLYGLGSIAGPVLSSLSMGVFGVRALFAYTMTVHLLTVVYGLWRMTRRRAVGVAEQEDYVAMPQTSPMVFELDPKVEEIIADRS